MNPQDVPTYGLAEAAHYLHLPPSTLGNWLRGHKHFKRVISVPKNQPKGRSQLSFTNLVEAHMLATIRRTHNIPLRNIRPAIDYLRREFKQEHPLATMPLKTDEVNLFIEVAGELLNITKQGQVAIKEAVEAHLRRVKRAPDNTPLVLYPFIAGDLSIDRKTVMFDPKISFGRLVIADSGIPTFDVFQRFRAGETIKELAEDFGRDPMDIEDAIRCEFPLAEAA